MIGRQSEADADDDVNIELSPMIDCVFILLIFFIVTTVFVEETGVKVNKPDVASASALDKNSILIAITSDNKVMYGGRSIGVTGVQSVVRPLVGETEDMPVIIQGDEKASHGIVQQVVGQCMAAGAQKDKISTSTK